MRLPVVAVAWLFQRFGPRPTWVWVRLPARVTALPPGGSFWQRRLRRVPRTVSLEQVDRLTHALARDHTIDGVIIEVPHLQAGWSTLGHLRSRLQALQEAGKRVVAFLPQGAGDREVYLSAAADRILLAPPASISLLGSAAGGLYLRDLLARLGLRAQVMAEGAYKTAAERLSAERMSEPERAQLTAVLSARQSLLDTSLAGRLVADTSAAALFEEASFSGQRAVEAGLVDELTYEDGVLPAAGVGDAPEDRKRCVRAFQYNRRQLKWFPPVTTPPYLAVVPIHGAISGRTGPAFAGGADTTLDATVALIRRLRSDRRAVGVLLHVNSPGGSALVSDLVHHEIEALAADKPVVAFFADVAASGGYYIGAAAQEIVCAPEAITGSIGVISLKLVAEDLLAKLAVRSEVVKSAPHADMFSPARPLTEAEQTILKRESEAVYRRFLEVVANGRGRTVAEVEAVAGGRVWSAPDALTHGLVDVLGDMQLALERLRARVPLADSARARLRPRVVRPSGRPPPPALAPKSDGPQSAVSQAWELLQGLNGERVMCCCPTSLEIYLSGAMADSSARLSG